jgi:hypothetical protein
VATLKLAGQVRTGGVISTTVMSKVQFAVLPAASVAVQVTVVTPLGKFDPEGGLHTEGHVSSKPHGQLSLAGGGVKSTRAAHWFGSVGTVKFSGQKIVGG